MSWFSKRSVRCAPSEMRRGRFSAISRARSVLAHALVLRDVADVAERDLAHPSALVGRGRRPRAAGPAGARASGRGPPRSAARTACSRSRRCRARPPPSPAAAFCAYRRLIGIELLLHPHVPSMAVHRSITLTVVPGHQLQHVARLRAPCSARAGGTAPGRRPCPVRVPGNVRVERALRLAQRQVLEHVAGRAGDRVRFRSRCEQRVLVLQHVRARRLRDDHGRRPPRPRGRARPGCVRAFARRARDVAAVEIRHAAADLLRAGDVAAVALEHRDRVASDLRLVVVDRAGEEERDLPRGRRGGTRPPLAEPARERLVVEARQVAVAMRRRPPPPAARGAAGTGWPRSPGARRRPRDGPSRSMLPRNRSCRVTPSALARAALARSMSRGKSMSKRCGGVYGQWLKQSLHC